MKQYLFPLISKKWIKTYIRNETNMLVSDYVCVGLFRGNKVIQRETYFSRGITFFPRKTVYHTYYATLQYTATRCNTLQHTALQLYFVGSAFAIKIPPADFFFHLCHIFFDKTIRLWRYSNWSTVKQLGRAGSWEVPRTLNVAHFYYAMTQSYVTDLEIHPVYVIWSCVSRKDTSVCRVEMQMCVMDLFSVCHMRYECVSRMCVQCRNTSVCHDFIQSILPEMRVSVHLRFKCVSRRDASVCNAEMQVCVV